MAAPEFFAFAVQARARDEQHISPVVVVICPETRAFHCVGYIAALPSCRRKEEDEESLLLHLGVKCFSLIFTSTGSLGSLVTHTRAHRDYIKADFTRDFAYPLFSHWCARVYILGNAVLTPPLNMRRRCCFSLQSNNF